MLSFSTVIVNVLMIDTIQMADNSCWQNNFYLSLFLSSHVISYCSLIGRCLVSNKILILSRPMGISVGCACTRGPDFRGKQPVRFYVAMTSLVIRILQSFGRYFVIKFKKIFSLGKRPFVFLVFRTPKHT